MNRQPLHEILKKQQLLEFGHTLVYRFFERKTTNTIIISAVEISHLGKNIRLLNSAMILTSIYDVPSNKIHVNLDAADTLYNYFKSKDFNVTRKDHNSWAEYSIIVEKKIDITTLEEELYQFFNFYRNLCIDNNIAIDEIPLF